MNVHVYTDASFDHKLCIAACSFIAIVNGKELKHETTMYGSVKTSTDAELLAIQNAVQWCFLLKNVKNIVVHTDCKTLTDRYKASRNSKYKELKITLDICKEHKVNCQIVYVKGHNGNTYNHKVDRSSNENLRKYIESL